MVQPVAVHWEMNWGIINSLFYEHLFFLNRSHASANTSFISSPHFVSVAVKKLQVFSSPGDQWADVREGQTPLCSSSLLSACHSFSPFLIPSEFLFSLPRCSGLEWRSCCHVSRHPAGFIPTSFTPQIWPPSWWNYEFIFMCWLLSHDLY